MANLIPSSQNDDIVELERGDPILGARLGMSNRQAQQLLNRLTYNNDVLHQAISDKHDELDDDIDDLSDYELSLRHRMDSIEARSDVVDVVATYADILNYNTSTLNENDIVKCLGDANHAGIATYYRWNGTSFTFIGSEKKSVPITVTASTTLTPVRNVTYVLSGNNLSITLGNGSYTGLSVNVGSMGSVNCIAGYYLDNDEWLNLTWNGTRWCPKIPTKTIDDAYPVGTVLLTTTPSVPSIYGTWTQVTTGNILMTAGQSYAAETQYGSNSVSYTVTGSIGNTTLTAAQCPAHYHTYDNYAVGIYVAYSSSGSHTHTAYKAWGDGGNFDYDEGSNIIYKGVETTFYTNSDAHAHSATNGWVSSVGSGGAHGHTFSGSSVSVNIVQPYYNIYMFKRTA